MNDSDDVLDQRVGPFQDRHGAATLLGTDDAGLSAMITARAIVAVPLAGGDVVFPAWQFTAAGTPDLRLLAVWATLSAVVDPWTAALWMTSPCDDLGASTSVSWVRSGGASEPVLAAAQRAAARWSA